MKILFVYNAHSGVSGEDISQDIENYIQSSPHECTVFETKKTFGPVEYLVTQHKSFDIIVSIGGDGTISQTVDGIMKTKMDTKLIIVPFGSTNEYAKSLGIHYDSIQDVFRAIDHGEDIKVDVGKINNKHFTYVACFGNFTSVTYETPQKLKNAFGHAAYWLYGALRLRMLRNYEFTIEHDETIVEGNYLFGLISNAYRFGRVFRYPRTEVDLDDGFFELLLIKRPKKASEFLKVLYAMLVEDYSGENFIKHKLDKITLKSKRKHSWNLDGEFGGKTDTVSIQVLNKKLNLRI